MLAEDSHVSRRAASAAIGTDNYSRQDITLVTRSYAYYILFLGKACHHRVIEDYCTGGFCGVNKQRVKLISLHQVYDWCT